jgi:Phage integrase, N-terminal SAM-like domain.
MRVNRYSPRTEQAYIDWIKRFIRFHGVRHPQEMGAEEVKAFLSHLATKMNVAASTQNQAFSALLFLACASRDAAFQASPRYQGVFRTTTRARVRVRVRYMWQKAW